MYCHPDRSKAQRAQWRDLVFRAPHSTLKLEPQRTRRKHLTSKQL